jgi:hypothetical protein
MYQRSYQIDYFCGWRYLLSPEFREQARKKWGRNLFLRCLFTLGSIASILLTSIAGIMVLLAILELIK